MMIRFGLFLLFGLWLFSSCSTSTTIDFWVKAPSHSIPSWVFSNPMTVKMVKAAAKGDTALANSYIQKGANINEVGSYSFTPLAWMLHVESEEGWRYLLKKGANYMHAIKGQWSSQFHSIIEIAIIIHDTKYLKIALEEGIDPNISFNVSGNESPLSYSWHLRYDMALLLFDYGADMDFVEIEYINRYVNETTYKGEMFKDSIAVSVYAGVMAMGDFELLYKMMQKRDKTKLNVKYFSPGPYYFPDPEKTTLQIFVNNFGSKMKKQTDVNRIHYRDEETVLYWANKCLALLQEYGYLDKDLEIRNDLPGFYKHGIVKRE